MLFSIGFGNPVLPGFWVGKGFVAGEGWGYNLFLEADGQLTRKYVVGDESDGFRMNEEKAESTTAPHIHAGTRWCAASSPRRCGTGSPPSSSTTKDR